MNRISPSHRQIRRSPGRNLAAAVATFASIATLTACGAQAPDVVGQSVQADPFRGDLVSSTKVAELKPAAAKKALASAGFSTEHATYGVTAYRLIYRTIDLDGEETTASGLVVLPTTGRRELQAVSYAHGTTTYKSDVASQWNDDYTTSPGVMYAAAGYVAVLPDYIGLGHGLGVHPWMHLATETSASLDMLRASDAFATTQNHTLARDVLVTGFSQGASSALGLGRALQDGAEPRFALGALAPISGAYDFAGTEIPALLRRARHQAERRLCRADADVVGPHLRVVRRPRRGVPSAVRRRRGRVVRRHHLRGADVHELARHARRTAHRPGPRTPRTPQRSSARCR